MSIDSYPAVRLDRNRAAMLFVDHQAGLLMGVKDHDQDELRRNLIALAKMSKTFDLPVVVTTSSDDGANGPLLGDLVAELPDANVVRRPGEVDAMDNDDFRAAVAATGRDQLIISGISTDVCVAFTAMSTIAAGYVPWAVLDASGTWSGLAADAAADRMSRAGVTLTSTVAIAAELLRDWRSDGGQDIGPIFAQYAIPAYSSMMAFVDRG